jgi:hypothetical protein
MVQAMHCLAAELGKYFGDRGNFKNLSLLWRVLFYFFGQLPSIELPLALP